MPGTNELPFYFLIIISVPRKSLLTPPKASPSTWQIYFTDQLQLYRARHPDQKLNVAQAAKELAQEYKRMTPEEREVCLITLCSAPTWGDVKHLKHLLLWCAVIARLTDVSSSASFPAH